MKSITIPGNKQTPAKTFTIGNAYYGELSYLWRNQNMAFKVAGIIDGRVHWKDMFRGTTGSFVTKQFSVLSKTTTALDPEAKGDLVEDLFEHYGRFPFDD